MVALPFCFDVPAAAVVVIVAVDVGAMGVGSGGSVHSAGREPDKFTKAHIMLCGEFG